MDHEYPRSPHTHHSSFRESLLEHLFVGELLKRAWLRGALPTEVMKPQVDDAGYDLLIECRRIQRHVQLKSSFIGSKTAKQKVQLRLADKPSGCVVWLYFDRVTLDLGPFLFFGGAPGEALPSLSDFRIARHTKANAAGHKAHRPALREVPKGQFQQFDKFDELAAALFGDALRWPPAA